MLVLPFASHLFFASVSTHPGNESISSNIDNLLLQAMLEAVGILQHDLKWFPRETIPENGNLRRHLLFWVSSCISQGNFLLRAGRCQVQRTVSSNRATDFVLRIVSFSFNIVFKPATTEDYPQQISEKRALRFKLFTFFMLPKVAITQLLVLSGKSFPARTPIPSIADVMHMVFTDPLYLLQRSKSVENL